MYGPHLALSPPPRIQYWSGCQTEMKYINMVIPTRREKVGEEGRMEDIEEEEKEHQSNNNTMQIIELDQSPRAMSPATGVGPSALRTSEAHNNNNDGHHHRLPRPYLDNPNAAYRLSRRGGRRPGLNTPSSEEGDGGSPNRPRSSQSSTSAETEAPPPQIVNPESSILFSKVPTTAAADPSPSLSTSSHHQHQHQLDNPMASRSSEHHHHSKQQKKVTITTRSEIGGRQGRDHRNPSSSITHSHSHSRTDRLLDGGGGERESQSNMSTLGYGLSDGILSPLLGTHELEANLRRTRPNQVISAYLDLAEMIKKMDRQAELREELLKRSQKHIESKERQLREKDVLVRRLQSGSAATLVTNGMTMGTIHEEPEGSSAAASIVEGGRGEEDFGTAVKTGEDKSVLLHAIRCRYHVSGCPYRLPSMEFHEDRECRFRPTRCPSLTCPVRPPFAKLMQHILDEHEGNTKGRDRICRNNASHLVSSYVNIDKEPVFYKTSKMTWVANELVLEGRHFFLECFRSPPDWHLWVYLVGSEREAQQFHATIQLFREDEYGRVHEYSKQRSWTGPTISIHRSKEEIAEYSLGFQVHDKQIRSLCGPIRNNEEQLFGYEVTIYRK